MFINSNTIPNHHLSAQAANVAITAASDIDAFTDIRIETLISVAKSSAVEQAAEQSNCKNLQELLGHLTEVSDGVTSHDLMEFFEIHPNYIHVGVDRDLVDDAAIDDVTNMIMTISDLTTLGRRHIRWTHK